MKAKVIHYRRKRAGLTNYKKRLKLLLSNKPRLVVRKSLNNISAQLVEYKSKGDIVIVSAHSSQLKKLGWKYHCGNIPSSYLTGLLLGKKVLEKKINNIILDTGMQKSTKGSRIYAVVKGIVDAGVNIAHSEDILPDQDRISGKHIETYASKLDQEKLKKQFSKSDDPKLLSKNLESLKKKILGEK